MSSLLLMMMLVLVLLGVTITNSQAQAQAQLCQTTSCGELSNIEFPFRLKQSNQRPRCGYPGFDLSCNNKTQALLSLPSWGDVVVTSISLENQQVWINDPHGCLPKRFIGTNFSLQGSPFQLGDYYNLLNYSFFNCSSNVTASYPMLEPISCLTHSNDLNHSVLAVLSNPPFSIPWTSSCHLISSASVPAPFTDPVFWRSFDSDIMLQWDDPDCGDCVSRGGRCGVSFGSSGRSIQCYDLPASQAQGLSKKTKYGVAFGVGIPGLVGVMVLACIFWGKMKRQDVQRRQAHTEFSSSIIPHRTVLMMGLDGASIEKYPKTQLGESGRLPNPNDNICSICLCEYQPKDTLRTIPECNHYFHVICIDGWLRMNATCPLCRKLPHPPMPAFNNNIINTSNVPLSPTPS